MYVHVRVPGAFCAQLSLSDTQTPDNKNMHYVTCLPVTLRHLLSLVCQSLPHHSLTCHNTELCLGFKSIQHLNDVLMPQLAQDLNLLSQVFDVLLALPLLHDELHSCDLTRAFPSTLVNL